MRVLSRSDILGAADLPREFVRTPEWAGGDPEAGVYVRTITGAERDEFEQGTLERRGRNIEVNLANIRAKLVAVCAADETGKQIFTEEDVAALGRKSAAPLDRLFSAAQRLSGFNQADIDELAKNSPNGQLSSSLIGSP